MDAVLTSLIAVLGTLLGTLASFRFQSRAAERNERFQREERLRQDRLAVGKEFAAALQEYRSGQHARWHRAHEEWDGPAATAARAESYRLRTVAWQALSHVRLLFQDPGLVEQAQLAFDQAGKMHRARDKQDLELRDHAVREAIEAFLGAVGPHVR